MLKSNKILALSIALAACIAAPSACAQDAARNTESQEAMAQQASPPARANHVDQADQADKSAEPAKSWSALDVNNNGSLSSSEAASMDSLAKVFSKADADGNGELTQDEYKTWLASNGAKRQPDKHGG